MNRRVLIVPAESYAARAAELLADAARRAIAERGRFTIALSGGSTVEEPYRLFGEADLDWSKVHLFWGDDRFVPHDNPLSNARLVQETLLAGAAVPAANVHRIPTDADTPAAGAEQYASLLRDFFILSDGELPVFDVAQNGMGPDGHTASLFPKHAAVHESQALAVATHAGLAPWVDRVTLTLPVFCAAREVIFFVRGEGKGGRVREVLEGPIEIDRLPAQGVLSCDGRITWLLDDDAGTDVRESETE